MKNVLPVFTALARQLGLISMIFTCSLANVLAEVPTSAFGVWDRGSSFDPKEYPFLKGLTFNDHWADVEKEPGVFDWSRLDQAVEKAFQNKSYIYLALNVGPQAPDWIYEHGVPKVFTDDTKHSGWKHYPYYLAPAYKFYFERVITELGKHIRSYPQEKQDHIAFIQVKSGCTGDEAAYKGKPKDSQYELDKQSPEWLEYRLETFALFVKTFQESPGRPIDLLFNCVAANQKGEPVYMEEWDWVSSHIKGGFGIKNGALSRGHHISGERALYNKWTPFLVDPKGLTLFRRSEMDQTWTKSWYQLNLPLNFYWGAVNALNGGQSVWDITRQAVRAAKEEGFDYSFYFFNKYAGQIHPETATDAFCALHKGLDGADTKAYPEADFGEATPENVDRMLKICERFAKYGARAEDPDSVSSRRRSVRTGFNDVGWDIWPDNYTRFLYQIDADKTSIPRWHVGGPITKTSSIYARFARGFEHASGKDAMYFKLHDNFFKNDKLKTKVVTVHVIWHDGQEGSTWKLDYDAGGPSMKTAFSITGTGDKQWHDKAITLTDAVLKHGGTKGSDFALVNTDGKDDIFSILEVHRGVSEGELMYTGKKSETASSTQPAKSEKRANKRKSK